MPCAPPATPTNGTNKILPAPERTPGTAPPGRIERHAEHEARALRLLRPQARIEPNEGAPRMRKTYKYRIYPKKAQAACLSDYLRYTAGSTTRRWPAADGRGKSARNR